MEKIKDIEDYLKKSLVRPSETGVVIEGIQKLLRQKARYVSMTPEVFYCPRCEKWITKDQIKTVEVSRQTMTDPPEDADFCECGGSGEDFESIELAADELVEILNDKEFRL